MTAKHVQNKLFRERFYPTRRPSMSKTILITGASSGFGRDTAETLFRAGHTVYASMRRAEGKNREAAEALWKLGVKTVAAVLERDYGVRLSYEREVEFGRTIQ